ncbi:hypothetical protein [Endozoicomonas sp. 2B-B]
MDIDTRFLDDKRTRFYFFDRRENVPIKYSPISLFESEISEKWTTAGKRHIAEWSFILNEYENKFCEYPFYCISSRFFEKNQRLAIDLSDLLDIAFKGLREYGYGYLPSYDRDFAFIDIKEYIKKGYLGSTESGFKFIEDIFCIDMFNEYCLVSDFWCNYVGFQSRKHLEDYVEFYLPIFNKIFDEYGEIKWDYLSENIVERDVNFRNFKPLSLLLEQVSHLFFYKNCLPFFGVSYGKTLVVNEFTSEAKILSTFQNN